MDQRKKIRKIIPGISHRLSQILPDLSTQIMALGIASNQECKFYFGHESSQIAMPGCCAFGSGRQIPAFPSPRVAKAHGHNSKKLRIVKSVPVDIQPSPEFIPTGVIPGNSRSMYFGTRSLPYDEDFAPRMYGKNRPRPQGKYLPA